ncbi:type II secretion system minor pseudopilin GspJ [Stutzerimonas azotifigens]|uniref:type II secretion system minor pseudopilin GspJ n=1 Tax=Stutzerimonas azotifigens TaxID=291995 RepID=UPI0004123298|nr:type II secretion system minor pseudopilin GspJ [Stutzerimonas azotifigens]
MGRQRGFTLLELLIAIALFALLALGTYRMLESVLRSDEATRAQEQVLRELTRAVWAFERDLMQAAPRPIRDNYGDERAALVASLEPDDGAEAAVEFSRIGWRNPTGLRRAELQRVRWRLVGQTLERQYWTVLDRDIGSRPRVQRVLEGVSGLELRYLDGQGAWHQDWPPFDYNRANPETEPERLPLAVEFAFEHPHYGRILRLVRLPDASASRPQALPDAEGRPGTLDPGLLP